MAENVVVTTLEIKGGDKVSTTMKDLKNEISGYRDELVALGQIEKKTEQQMERQEQVVKKLQKATKLLTEVTNAHKEGQKKEEEQIDLVNDSYNALQKELTKLKKAYKDMSGAERESALGQETLQQISSLDTRLKELDAGMGVYSRNVGNYGMTFEDSMKRAKESAGFMQQGLGTLMGVVNLMGVENEGVIKTITTLTLAMQVLGNEGVGRLVTKMKDWIASKMAATAATKTMTGAMGAEAAATNTATTATNGFKKALIATGIGAIIVLIGTLVANWEDLSRAIGLSDEEAEKAIDDMTKGLEKLEQQMENNIATMEAMGASQSQVYSYQIQALNDIVAKYEELSDMILETELDKFWTDYERITESIDKAREKKEEFNQQMREANNQILAFITAGHEAYDTRYMSDYEKGVRDINRQYEEARTLVGVLIENGGILPQSALETLEELRYWRDEQLALLEEEENKRLDQQMAAAKKEEEAEKKRLDDLAKAREEARIREENEEWAAVQEEERMRQAELDAINEQIRAEIESEKKKREEEKAIRDQRVQDAYEEYQAYAEQLAEQQRLEDEALEKKKERVRIAADTSMASADAISGLLNAVADSIDAFGGENKKAQQVQKGVKIASTTIETISGATSAFMSAQSLPFPLNTIIGSVQAAAVAATGAANIAKIKATPIDGGGASPSISTPSASVAAPNIQTQLPQMRNLTSASEEDRLNSLAASQKVYILQSDIEAAGAMSKAQVQESSF